MEWQHWAMIVMFAGSAVLPIVGLWKAYRSATKWSRAYAAAPKTADGEGMSFGQFNVTTAQKHDEMRGKPSVAAGDVILIGIGLTLGAAGSIWAVIDSVA